MKRPLNHLSPQKLLAGQFPGRMFGLAQLSLVLLAGISALAQPAAGQEVNPNNPRSAVQTAARSNVTRPPSASRTEYEQEGAPSKRPRVVYEDGQLSIAATDSTLADVLYALRACTGADIDIPAGVAGEHVTAQLGPGPARKVLSDLLEWSSFDYVIQGGGTDPLSIQSVTLMVRTKNPTPAPTPASPNVPLLGRHTVPPAHQGAEPAPDPAEIPEAENRPDNKPDPSATSTDLPGTPQNYPQNSLQSSPSRVLNMGSAMGDAAGKSPADMIQELQQMYQQRRMLQTQQNTGAGGVPASGAPQ